MDEYEVEIVTELDEVEIIRVMTNSPQEAEEIATMKVENGETHLYGRDVINANALQQTMRNAQTIHQHAK